MRKFKVLIFRELIQQLELDVQCVDEDEAWDTAREWAKSENQTFEWETVEDSKENVAYVIIDEEKHK